MPYYNILTNIEVQEKKVDHKDGRRRGQLLHSLLIAQLTALFLNTLLYENNFENIIPAGLAEAGEHNIHYFMNYL